MESLAKIKPMITSKRMKMPRLGTRKLYYLLQNEIKQAGVKIGRDGLFSYLKWENMLIKPAKNYTATTNSKHWLRKYPNLYLDCELTRAEQVFVSDITYVKSKERTHYLSLVTDAFSRKIMGYELSDNMSSENVAKALSMAVRNRTTNLPLIHHSDRGLQYCSNIYQNKLKQSAIQPSMTEGGNCYQNALAERMNGILKQEFLFQKCNTGKELKKLISESIKTYNNERPHLNLKMKTPTFMHEKGSKKINSTTP